MSQGNPDIRQQVEDNRGALKKLQLIIPGLRGYREKEDLRVSDELLRNEMADKLDHAKSNLDALRKQLVGASDFTNLTAVGSLIGRFKPSVERSGTQPRDTQGGWLRLRSTKTNSTSCTTMILPS